jgi:hypothetical protein
LEETTTRAWVCSEIKASTSEHAKPLALSSDHPDAEEHACRPSRHFLLRRRRLLPRLLSAARGLLVVALTLKP